MPVYNIADLNILIEPKHKNTAQRLAPYESTDSNYDFEISLNAYEAEQHYIQNDLEYSPASSESTLILTKLCNTVLKHYDGFFFHSSSLMLDGEAYVFSAPSGTGKSTHTALWRKHFGDRVTMINDDKPIIRKKDGRFFIYGTPWMGKANIGTNTKAPIKAVFILQRGNTNSAVRVKPGEVFKQILEATIVPSDKNMMFSLLGLLDEFFTLVPLFLLTCNLSDDAVITAYNASNNITAKD